MRTAKTFGIGGLIGIALGLGVIYLLRPLNEAAVALVLTFTTGLGVALTAVAMKVIGKPPLRDSPDPPSALSVPTPTRAYSHKGKPVRPRSGLGYWRPYEDKQWPDLDGEPYGAYGYLVFTGRPSDETRTRYRVVCQSFRSTLEDVGKYKSVDPGDLMVTSWPIDWPLVRAEQKEKEEEIESLDACERDLRFYDYAYANQMASAIGKLKEAGPLLVASRGLFDTEDKNEGRLVLDMSDFADVDLERALRIWKDRIARDPEAWNDGFNILKFREAFRNHIQEYGESIVDFLRDVRPLKDEES